MKITDLFYCPECKTVWGCIIDKKRICRCEYCIMNGNCPEDAGAERVEHYCKEHRQNVA